MNWLNRLIERTYVAAAFAEVGEWKAAAELSQEVDRRYRREKAEDRKKTEKRPRPQMTLR
jgi:nucleoid-associated protein YgaU